MDRLQTKIRKLKMPVVLDLLASKEQIPHYLLVQEGNYLRAYGRFCLELMETLKGEIPAVRFSYSLFSLLGTEGISWLSKLCSEAKNLGYYVFLDMPDAKTASQSAIFAELILDDLFSWYFDGLIVSSYIGTDGYSGYLPLLKDKDLFVMLRSPNKSAAQIQDLMVGGRLVHTAMADELVRAGKSLTEKYDYSRLGGIVSATAPGSLQQLRAKYKALFLLVDGYDARQPNGKNCAFAFDALGYGGAICVGSYITEAWKAEFCDETSFLTCAKDATAKLKKNIARYITIL